MRVRSVLSLVLLLALGAETVSEPSSLRYQEQPPDVTITVDMDLESSSSLPPYWKRSFGSGHAALAQREDWQEALGAAVKDYGLGGIRQHGIFDDDMGVVRLAPNGRDLLYNWTKVDVLWSALQRHGVRPVVELSFMPWVLANCSSPAAPHPDLEKCPPPPGGTWVRTGSAYPPRRWKDWHDLVYALASHAVEMFGLEEVRQWSFEVWNEMWGVPGHGHDEQTAFYTRTFYRYAALAVKAVDSRLRVGGPASASASEPIPFLRSAQALGLPYDFTSFHLYGNADGCNNGNYGHSAPNPAAFYWDPDCYIESARWAVQELRKVDPQVPVYLTEYSVSVGESRLSHDTNLAAAFVFRIVGELAGLLEVLSYWTFSDIFEEVGLPRAEFTGGYGLTTLHGVSKPVRRAFELLHRAAGDRQLAVVLNSTANHIPAQGTGCQLAKDLGCFQELPSDPSGCFNITDRATMIGLTHQKCLDHCWTRGAADGGPVKFVGLANGNECWCSSQLQTLNHTRCAPVTHSYCNSTCDGDTTTTCGGQSRIRAHTFECAEPPPAAKPLNPVRAFATTSPTDKHAANPSAQRNVSVFLSAWDEQVDSKQGSTQRWQAKVQLAGESVKILSAVVHRIDSTHANPRATWESMGSPAIPSPAQLDTLKRTSEVPMDAALVATDGKSVQLEVPPNAAYLLELTVVDSGAIEVLQHTADADLKPKTITVLSSRRHGQ